MNLSTIDMSKTEARKRFLEYRASVKERHNHEDEQIMRGYRELSRGRQIIDLPETIRAGGVDDMQRPNLAVARADTQWVRLERLVSGTIRFHRSDRQGSWRADQRCAYSAGLCLAFPDVLDPIQRGIKDSAAMVPIVPPALRPSNLGAYHVLFEAEWQLIPPRDPALIRRIGGNLWAVVAVWDLTELERSVLAGRRHHG